MRVPLYLLGRDAAGGWKLAADVSAVPQSRLAELQLGFRELRGLMPLLERGELAIAGHAVALSQWHQVCEYTLAARLQALVAPWMALMLFLRSTCVQAEPSSLTRLPFACIEPAPQAHAFCPRCGAPTVSSEGGARRQCTADAKHRSYPRTDPVASGPGLVHACGVAMLCGVAWHSLVLSVWPWQTRAGECRRAAGSRAGLELLEQEP